MQTIPFTIEHLHAAYASGTSVETIIDVLLERLKAADDPGIFIDRDDRAALLASAAALGPFDPVAKPLWGIPFAVKDNIDVAGRPTTAACPDFAYLPAVDATVVARLKAAGALYVGKTNLDQFATGLVGVRTPYPVPRNSIDPAIVPGGSSSGSAVATARGIVAFALGTDTAGSGRVPAALNNIVGLKPSLGALSTRGVVPACRTLDCVSIFAQTVEDSWRVFDVAAAFDPEDPYSRKRDAIKGVAIGGLPVIGIPSPSSIRFFGDDVQAAAFAGQRSLVEAAGYKVVEVDFEPLYAVADMLYEGAWVAERLAAISDFMGAHEGSLHPVTAKIIGGAKSLTAVDAFRGLYKLEALKRQAEDLLSGIDMLCVPTIPTFYTVADLEADPIGPNSRFGTYTNFVNLLDMCGMAFPLGARTDERPASVTLLARGGQDRLVASIASALSQKGEGSPAIAAPEADGIEIVVVGAHLSGMPLNRELLALKGSFCRKATTTADYRLFALPNTVPPKPGLLRVAPGQGGAIEVEVWKLSPDGFGRFVAAIPGPLGIGTLQLADGTSAKGFLVEAVAVEGGKDITSFGGWRAYVAAM